MAVEAKSVHAIEQSSFARMPKFLEFGQRVQTGSRWVCCFNYLEVHGSAGTSRLLFEVRNHSWETSVTRLRILQPTLSHSAAKKLVPKLSCRVG